MLRRLRCLFIFQAVLFLYILTLRLVQSQSFVLTDLTSNDSNFLLEASFWVVSSVLTPTVTCTNTCASTYLLGGPGILGLATSPYQKNQYFQRIYMGLLSHTYVYFRMSLWAMDGWSLSANDQFSLYFNGTTIAGWKMDNSWFNQVLCGVTAQNDVRNIVIFGTVAHTSSTLDFRFISKLTELSSVASFGIRDILFTVAQNPAAASSNTICGVTTISIGASNLCACPIGKYGTGTCSTCDPSCKSCFGSSPKHCYECNVGYAWTGLKCTACNPNCVACYGASVDQCTSCISGYYLFNNRQCVNACDLPLISGSDDNGATCSLPCTPGLYLDWNLNCVATCDFPLQALSNNTAQGPVLMCIYPCQDGEYLYWDGTCQTSCDSPTTYVTEYNGKPFCNFPCAAPTPIVYWDGSCSNTCASPLVYLIHSGKGFCSFPCGPSEYLYSNGSCLTTCESTFNATSIKGELLCNYPCASNQYLYTNGSCLSYCATNFIPSVILNEKYCAYPCSPLEFLFTNLSCLDSCPTAFSTIILSGEKYCNYSCPFSQYQYLNGTCANYCEPLFHPWFDSTSLRYCDYPCLDTDYLYSNGTCSPYCDDLFTTRVEGSTKFCDYPCGSSQYLYNNGTCLNYCEPNFIHYTYIQDKFCDYPCQDNEYLYDNGTCGLSCDLGFTINIYGYDQFCEYPCQTNEYLYENGSCMSSCPSTYNQWSQQSGSFCDYPCSYDEYLFNNGSCQASCPSYMLSQTVGFDNFCEYPCSSNMFLYENGSCISSCSSPFIQEIYGSDKYCLTNCEGFLNFRYWNGSCSFTCPLPFIQTTQGLLKFCLNPCSNGQVLNWNSTCIDECVPPFITKIEGYTRYCASPCPSPRSLSLEGSCILTCESPYALKNYGLSGNLCTYPCNNSDEYFYQETGECKTECTLQTVVTQDNVKLCLPANSSVGEFLIYLSTPPSTPGTPTLVVLSESVLYTKYLDIQYPPRLQSLNFGQGRSILSLQFGFSMPTEMSSRINNHEIPSAFQRYSLHSSFLVNAWQVLTSIAIVIIFAFVFRALELFCQKKDMPDWQHIFERFRVIVKWNLVLMVIATSIDDIIFYACIDFSSLDIDSAAAVFSFLLAILMVAVSLNVMIATYYFVANTRKVKLRTTKEQLINLYANFLVRWQDFQVLYRGFKETSIVTNLFFLFYVLRRALPALIAAYVNTAPLTQTSAFTLLNVFMLIYLLWKKPFKKIINHTQILTLELLGLIINLCILILAILDTFMIDNNNLFVVLGDIVLVCNFGLNLLPLVSLVVRTTHIIRLSHLFQKGKATASGTSFLWIQLLFLPLQQSGFGFEQVQVARFRDNAYKEQINDGKQLSVENIENESESVRTLESFNIFSQKDMGPSPFLGRVKRRRQSLEDMIFRRGTQDLVVIETPLESQSKKISAQTSLKPDLKGTRMGTLQEYNTTERCVTEDFLLGDQPSLSVRDNQIVSGIVTELPWQYKKAKRNDMQNQLDSYRKAKRNDNGTQNQLDSYRKAKRNDTENQLDSKGSEMGGDLTFRKRDE